MSARRLATVLALAALPLAAQEPVPAPVAPVAAQPAAAAPSDPDAELAQRPRIGLVLSGGGARGAAHVGVLQVLEELRIPVDAIAGTSMGSIVGGLYAAGLSTQELQKALEGVDWGDALTDKTGRELLSYRRKQDDQTLAMKIRVGLEGWKPALPLGIIQGQKLEVLLTEFTLPVATIEDFDDLVYPYRAVAADLATTDAVVIGSGDLARAMRASMSVPAVFAPVEIDGRLLIDGGVADNLPVDVVRTMGVDVVIAVDISSPMSKLENITSAYGVNDQMITGLMRRVTTEQMASLGPRDVGIVPDLGSFGAADFDKAGEIIPLGRAAAEAVVDQLRAYSLSEEAWQRYRAALKVPDRTLPRVSRVTVEENSKLSQEFLAGLIETQPGQPLDMDVLAGDLQRIYGLDIFEKVGYDLIDAGDGGVEVLVRVSERSWGTNYIQFGMSLAENLDTETRYALSFRLNRLALTPAGTEWRSDLRVGSNQLLRSELYHPLSRIGGWFIAPRVEYRHEPLTIVRENGVTSEDVLTAFGGAADIGKALGSWGELRFGIARESGSLRPDEGSSTDLDDGRVYTLLGADSRDNASFPRLGTRGQFELSQSFEALGAFDDLTKAELRYDHTWSIGRHVVTPAIELGSLFQDDVFGIPYALGGLGRLSGLGEGKIFGRDKFLARLGYSIEMLNLPLGTIKAPIYFGLTGEAGNTWWTHDEVDLGDLRYHGSAYIGIDSPLGPVFLGGGFGDDGERSAYFFLGRPF